MPPRAFTLPKATTASAKAARAAFFCDLCQKGYSRMNEFEAHESSYDHQHKKRMKEMREMQRQVVQQSSNKKEEKGPLMSIKLGSSKTQQATGGAGFRKGGFKNAFAPAHGDDDNGNGNGTAGDKNKVGVKHEEETLPALKAQSSVQEEKDEDDEEEDSDMTDAEDYYDPRHPTECMPGCRGMESIPT